MRLIAGGSTRPQVNNPAIPHIILGSERLFARHLVRACGVAKRIGAATSYGKKACFEILKGLSSSGILRHHFIHAENTEVAARCRRRPVKFRNQKYRPVMTIVSPGPSRVRTDIQALRGLAVSVVILFHSGLPVAPSGYFGVDMFFVVSGFLISGIVMRQIRNGSFSFEDFYIRRVRRLLPAAYIVLAVTLMMAIMLSTASAFSHYWQQFLGALTLSTNFVLWRQINYFNTGAAFEPLLHMWSLAVEEQYYLAAAIALFLLPKRLWLIATCATTTVSLLAYCWLYPQSPGVAFYLLPTRAWEIGLGSLATFVAQPSLITSVCRRLAPIAALVVVATCFVPSEYWFSYLLAVPACVGVAVIIIADYNSPAIARVLIPLALVGDFSYSLYLVHWPLFAFAHTIYMSGQLPIWLSTALIIATFVLAFSLYHCIEEPIRRSSVHPRSVWIIVAMASAGLAISCTVAFQIKRATAPKIDLTPVTGLENPFCNGDATRIDPRCARGANPQILIWGDSLSQAITPAIAWTTDRPLVEASKGQCAPLIGMAPVDGQASASFAKGCLSFNDSVLAYVAKTPSIKIVVLSGRYFRFMFPGTRILYRTAAGGTAMGAAGSEPMIRSQIQTTAKLRALGKRVIVISPPPQASFDAGECWDRVLSGLPAVMPSPPPVPTCAISGRGALQESPKGALLMGSFVQRAGTPVIRLDRMMCVRDICPTAWAGVPLYVDADHLSRTGSVLVGRKFGLGSLIWANAR